MTTTRHTEHGYPIVVDDARVATMAHVGAEQMAELPYRTDPATVAGVHVRAYHRRDFGPTIDIHYTDGHAAWQTHPGGFAHGGRYDTDYAATARAAFDVLTADLR